MNKLILGLGLAAIIGGTSCAKTSPEVAYPEQKKEEPSELTVERDEGLEKIMTSKIDDIRYNPAEKMIMEGNCYEAWPLVLKARENKYVPKRERDLYDCAHATEESLQKKGLYEEVSACDQLINKLATDNGVPGRPLKLKRCSGKIPAAELRPIPGVGIFEEICPDKDRTLYSSAETNPILSSDRATYRVETLAKGEFGEEKVLSLLKSLGLKVERKHEFDGRTSYKLNDDYLWLSVDTSPACQEGYTILKISQQSFPTCNVKRHQEEVDCLVLDIEPILAAAEGGKQEDNDQTTGIEQNGSYNKGETSLECGEGFFVDYRDDDGTPICITTPIGGTGLYEYKNTKDDGQKAVPLECGEGERVYEKKDGHKVCVLRPVGGVGFGYVDDRILEASARKRAKVSVISRENPLECGQGEASYKTGDGTGFCLPMFHEKLLEELPAENKEMK